MMVMVECVNGGGASYKLDQTHSPRLVVDISRQDEGQHEDNLRKIYITEDII